MDGFRATGKTAGEVEASYPRTNHVHGSDNRISTYRDFNPKVRPNPRPWYGGGELKRKKRIAKYKLYSVEGKIKNSLKKGFRWFKKTCSRIVHGF
ncbi:hypothetical protein F511_31850 [Dorcoceras hygrometricum]|uniref:Uncharacterized protein n=1 Tax=Dorcoceras hygrometricum TaxID=472368 RepID=A0A2Z7ADN2_9LAMI|nr:hypothetical protein F511_31850 [Dorcoceras hygrometricum]